MRRTLSAADAKNRLADAFRQTAGGDRAGKAMADGAAKTGGGAALASWSDGGPYPDAGRSASVVAGDQTQEEKVVATSGKLAEHRKKRSLPLVAEDQTQEERYVATSGRGRNTGRKVR